MRAKAISPSAILAFLSSLRHPLHMQYDSWLQEPSTATKRIIFARHGEYDCNVRGVCNSNPRIGYNLTEKGRVQARGWAKRFVTKALSLS